MFKYGYFGRRKKGSKIPPDFPFYKITVPTSIHYSTVDGLVYPKDVQQFISQLNATEELHVQRIDREKFNHLDFVWGIHATDVVYSGIIKFFAQFSPK